MAGNLKYKFSGHQTFAFRYGWLEKGVRGVAACPTLFSEVRGNTGRYLRATDIAFACVPCSTASQSVFGFRCSSGGEQGGSRRPTDFTTKHSDEERWII